ncbi:MAG: hypothetical protein IKI35_05735 [Stomatobaculum sp.]|nr:hypothetical protein [Stomatobaculum sp.]
MDEKNWYYEKLDEDYKIKLAPMNDFDGSVTGKIVIGVPEWFDENPAERVRLGWTKHITHKEKDVEYNRQTQYLVKSTKRLDEYTVEDEFHIMDKSEEMMLMEEISGSVGLGYSFGGITVVGADF